MSQESIAFLKKRNIPYTILDDGKVEVTEPISIHRENFEGGKLPDLSDVKCSTFIVEATNIVDLTGLPMEIESLSVQSNKELKSLKGISKVTSSMDFVDNSNLTDIEPASKIDADFLIFMDNGLPDALNGFYNHINELNTAFKNFSQSFYDKAMEFSINKFPDRPDLVEPGDVADARRRLVNAVMTGSNKNIQAAVEYLSEQYAYDDEDRTLPHEFADKYANQDLKAAKDAVASAKMANMGIFTKSDSEIQI